MWSPIRRFSTPSDLITFSIRSDSVVANEAICDRISAIEFSMSREKAAISTFRVGVFRLIALTAVLLRDFRLRRETFFGAFAVVALDFLIVARFAIAPSPVLNIYSDLGDGLTSIARIGDWSSQRLGAISGRMAFMARRSWIGLSPERPQDDIQSDWTPNLAEMFLNVVCRSQAGGWSGAPFKSYLFWIVAPSAAR